MGTVDSEDNINDKGWYLGEGQQLQHQLKVTKSLSTRNDSEVPNDDLHSKRVIPEVEWLGAGMSSRRKSALFMLKPGMSPVPQPP